MTTSNAANFTPAIKRDLTLADIIEQMATATGTLTFVDGKITMPDGTAFNLAAAMQPAYVLIQEGGSSSELYLHAFDSDEDALDDRHNCETEGSYRTSPVIEIHPVLAALGETFYTAAEELVGLVSNVDYPEPRPQNDDPDDEMEAADRRLDEADTAYDNGEITYRDFAGGRF